MTRLTILLIMSFWCAVFTGCQEKSPSSDSDTVSNTDIDMAEDTDRPDSSDSDTEAYDQDTIPDNDISSPSRGAWADCRTVPAGFCEAVSPARCYYVDPVNGADSGDGSFAFPWKSLKNINTAYKSEWRPANWTALSPGDHVYLMDGIFSTSHFYNPGDDSGPQGGGTYILYLRNTAGEESSPVTIKAYPRHHPVFDLAGSGTGIKILFSNYITVEGIEIQNSKERGFLTEGGSSLVFSRLVIHDTDGSAPDNLAGLEINGSASVSVSNSIFYDNYSRNDALNQNNANIVLFAGQNIVISSCIFYYTAGYYGHGVKYKHASRIQTGTFELKNSFFTHTGIAAAIGTGHAEIHHNLITDTMTGIQVQDLGGPTHEQDQHFHHNTIIAEMSFSFSPTLKWIDHENGPWNDVTDISFSDTIIYSTAQSYRQDLRTILLDPYMNDELFDKLAPEIHFSRNCYYNPSLPASFGFAESSGYGNKGSAGDLAHWQAVYGYDTDSAETNPLFIDMADNDYRLTGESPCAEKGVYTDGYAPVTDMTAVFRCE